MTREEAIENLSVAVGELISAIRRQAKAIERMADDMDKLNEAFRNIKIFAKRLPRQNRKPWVSPYAKFDKMRKRK